MAISNRIEYCKVNFPQIETERLILRQFYPEDYADHFEIISNETVTKYLDWGPYGHENDAKNIVNILINRLNSNRGINWALYHKQDHKVIGRIGAFWNLPHSNAEMNVEISEKYWQQGLASEAMEKICQFLLDDLGFNRLEARTKTENIATQKLFEKTGFQQEGVLRKSLFWKNEFHDIVMLSRLS